MVPSLHMQVLTLTSEKTWEPTLGGTNATPTGRCVSPTPVSQAEVQVTHIRLWLPGVLRADRKD